MKCSMILTSVHLTAVALSLCYGSVTSAEENPLRATAFTRPGAVGSVVGITVDDHGVVYVTQTNRRTNAAVDIRQHWDWISDTLASQSIEDKRALIKRRMPDWKKLRQFDEIIVRLEDSDGDKVAEIVSEAYRGFNTEISGLAGGVLAFDGNLYVTCIPSFWKLSDGDGDGRFEESAELVRGFGLHVGYGGHDMHGPTLGPDGLIYWSIGDKGVSVVRKEDGKRFHFPLQGAIMRCAPDGSRFEVYAHGLRNPQELAFDQYGNLFVVDNDGDMGDREGFRLVPYQSDSGWRATYQYRENNYNPWMAEHLWHPLHRAQPAYVTPPICNYSAGPAGFAYNPGTALDERYRGYFFLTEFPSKNIRAFRIKPDGAGYRMVDDQIVHNGLMTVGINFGPDGALYLADWGNNEWEPHQNGRIWRLDIPGPVNDPLRKNTQQLLAEDSTGQSKETLFDWLGHPDQRVRLKAQFELVDRGPRGRKVLTKAADRHSDQLGRIHGIWGLGQFTRHHADAVAPLVALIADQDAEIRAQAIRMIGRADYEAAGDDIAGCLDDPNPRVRYLAGVALGNIGKPRHFNALTHMIDDADNRDPYLRHAGIIGLTKVCENQHGRLANLSNHESTAVRLAAVVALRRLGSSDVAAFLKIQPPLSIAQNIASSNDDAGYEKKNDEAKIDDVQWIKAEAAMAVYDDFSIPQAMPVLAEVLDQPGLTFEPLLRRAISANIRVGKSDNAMRLMRYAAQSDNPVAMRTEALYAMAQWTAPPTLDRVLGRPISLPPRDAATAHASLDQYLAACLSDDVRPVRQAAMYAVKQLAYGDAATKLATIALDEALAGESRALAIEALDALQADGLRQVVEESINTDDPVVRSAALSVLVKLSPGDDFILEQIERAVRSNDFSERQKAIALLGTLEHPQAEEMLIEQLKAIVTNRAPKETYLEVFEATRAKNSPTLIKLREQYERSRQDTDPLANHEDLLFGGNAERGRIVFQANAIAQCVRCHVSEGTGGEVGPDLSHVAERLSRRGLLESMLFPQNAIAEGYGIIALTLKNGEVVAGIISNDDGQVISLKELDGTIRAVDVSDVAERSKPMSMMLPTAEQLNRHDIRDLVAYLATLQ